MNRQIVFYSVFWVAIYQSLRTTVIEGGGGGKIVHPMNQAKKLNSNIWIKRGCKSQAKKLQQCCILKVEVTLTNVVESFN